MGRKQVYQFSFASYPAVRIMIFFVIGITAAHHFEFSINSVARIFLLTVLVWASSEFLIRKKYSSYGARISAISYLILISVSAAALVTFQSGIKKIEIKKSEPLNLYAWESIVINGRVVQSGFSRSGRDVYLVEVMKTMFPEGVSWNHRYRIRIYGNNQDELSAGAYMEAEIRLYEFPEIRNPHEFDYGKWLHKQKIVAHGEIASLNKTEHKSRLSWAPFRSAVQHNADRIFTGDHAPLAKALLLGYKEQLNPETQVHFSRSGLSHIMAVSGLHVGFIVAPFWLLIPFFWGTRTGKLTGLILLTILLIGYAGITGFSASVSRASLMAWLLTYGKLYHKVRNSINLTAVAAIILLLINPAQLFEVGFQLSFAAVFIILLVMPEAQKAVPKKYRFGKAGGLITIILVSIVVQLGLFPILIYYFGEFSIAGPLANALVVPVLTFIVPVGLLFTLLSPIYYPAFQFGIIPVKIALDWINGVAESVGSSDYSYMVFDTHSVSLFLVWFAAIMIAATVRIAGVRWKMVILLLLSLNVMALESLVKQPAKKTLEVTFLDVGQGDAVHIVTPNGKNLLVDAGRWSPFSNSGDQVLVPYFESLGIEKLDAVFLSHPHSDHIGGVPSLIEAMKINAIYQSDYTYDSVLYKSYMNMAEEAEIPIKTPKAGDSIELDSAIKIFILGPENDSLRPANPNNRSLVLKLVYGNQSFLFTGDAEADQERELANRYGDFLKSNIYKAGHHGSNTSSTEEMLKFVAPDRTVVSLAFRNQFRHPGTDAVARINSYSEKIKYTSMNGAVVLRSNGSGTNIVNWK